MCVCACMCMIWQCKYDMPRGRRYTFHVVHVYVHVTCIYAYVHMNIVCVWVCTRKVYICAVYAYGKAGINMCICMCICVRQLMHIYEMHYIHVIYVVYTRTCDMCIYAYVLYAYHDMRVCMGMHASGIYMCRIYACAYTERHK